MKVRRKWERNEMGKVRSIEATEKEDQDDGGGGIGEDKKEGREDQRKEG